MVVTSRPSPSSCQRHEQERIKPQATMYAGSATSRRLQPAQYQRQRGIDARREIGVLPFVGMSRMVKADGGIEDRTRGGLDIVHGEHALRHAIGQDRRDL